MSQLTPEIFVALVVNAIEEIDPQLAIERVGRIGLLVNGQRFELENLWRMVQERPSDAEMMVFRYCEEIFINARSGVENLEAWVEVKPRIMPRIHPVSVFQHLDRGLVAHRPWVNDTVVAFVCDSEGSTVSLRRDQLEQWQVSIEELDAIAIENLERYALLPELTVTEGNDGGKLVRVRLHDGYDSSRILLEGMQHRIAEVLGPTFYAGIPARDVLIAYSVEPKPFVARVEETIKSAFERIPYPISPHSFLVTPDGVAGTISTSDDDEAW